MSERPQNIPVQELPEDIDELLERQLKAEAGRKAYQQRPDVQEKRKAYQGKQQDLRKMARLAAAGNIEGLVEMGYSAADAKTLTEKAAKVTA